MRAVKSPRLYFVRTWSILFASMRSAASRAVAMGIPALKRCSRGGSATSGRGGPAKGRPILLVSTDRCHDHKCLDGDQIKAGNGNRHPDQPPEGAGMDITGFPRWMSRAP